MRDKFYFHFSYFDYMRDLTGDEMRIIIDAIECLVESGEDKQFDNRYLSAVWAPIRAQIIKESVNYEEICKRNVANGKKGGRPKNPDKELVSAKTQTVFEETQKNPVARNRIDKNRIDKDIKETHKEKNADIEKIVNAWNDTELASVRKIDADSWRYKQLRARINEYGVDSILEVIEKVKNSSFLLGANESGWRCTFDWLIKASNMIKVLEGNYDNRGSPNSRKNAFINYQQHTDDLDEIERELKKQFAKGTQDG